METRVGLALVALVLFAGTGTPAFAQFCCTFESSTGASNCTDGIDDIQRCIDHGENPGVGDCATGCTALPFCCADFLGSRGLCYDGPPLACLNLGGNPGFFCQSDGTCEVPLIDNPR